jgi:hypothetical protein
LIPLSTRSPSMFNILPRKVLTCNCEQRYEKVAQSQSEPESEWWKDEKKQQDDGETDIEESQVSIIQELLICFKNRCLLHFCVF